jgi:hypothetical protein
MFIKSLVEAVLLASSWVASKNVAGFKSLYYTSTPLLILDASMSEGFTNFLARSCPFNKKSKLINPLIPASKMEKNPSYDYVEL